MGKKIVVKLFPDGTAKIDAIGFKGTGCEAATKAIEEILGKTTDKERKPEYYERVGSRNTQQVKQG